MDQTNYQDTQDINASGPHSGELSQIDQNFSDNHNAYNEVTIDTNGQSYEPESQDIYREDSMRTESNAYENPGTTLYVSKLSLRTTEETIYHEFSRFGKIQNCYLVVDPNTKDSRGFAFVTYETIEDANSALNNCLELKIDGNIVLVERSRRSRPRSPTPGRYCGTKPIPDRRLGGYNIRRDPRMFSRDYYDRPQMKYPYKRDYPSRDNYGAARDRGYDYPSRYGLKEQYPDYHMHKRGFERPPAPHGRDYYPRNERLPYPPRDPRDFHSGYSRDLRETRDFRVPRDPRERYPDYPRMREIHDPRPILPYERERIPFRPREDSFNDRYHDDRERESHYPPARVNREYRPRYEY